MRSSAGDWVVVRSKEEILRTLDQHGRLEGLPFMPEMFEFCGKRMRVFRRAHKTCDTVNPIATRGLSDGVHLEDARCNGAGHGGCQAACMLFWKEAWLRSADDSPVESDREAPPQAGAGCAETDVTAAALASPTTSGKARYQCQATELPNFTTPMSRKNVSQYVEDMSSRNVTIGELFMTILYFGFARVSHAKSRERGSKWRWLYNRVQALWGGTPYPRLWGKIEDPATAPVSDLQLRPGELVRVKPYAEILATLDRDNKNRGLQFDAEMVPYCGGVYRVRSRVERFLDENTGVMRTMRTPAVILETAWCRSRFSEYRLFCPRAIYTWWREAWLERAPPGAEETNQSALGARAILPARPTAEQV
jgi:hypothetical protein